MFEQLETKDSVFLRLEDEDTIIFVQATRDIPAAYTENEVAFRRRMLNQAIKLTPEEQEALKKLMRELSWPIATDVESVVLIESPSPEVMEVVIGTACSRCDATDSMTIPLEIFSYYPKDVEAIVYHRNPSQHMMVPPERTKPHIDIYLSTGFVLTIFSHELGYWEESHVVALIKQLLNETEEDLQQITLE